MLRVAFAVILALVGVPAWAADELLRGAIPDWVELAQVSPPALVEEDGPPVRVLLEDKQLNLGADGESEFTRTVTQIRSPLGLAASGSLSLAWSPDTDTLTVHHFRILRGDQVIDVLAKQDFTVIRRETNLERAILDGVLSATLQPEGVQQGDVIDIAYTRRRLDPVMQGWGEESLHARVFGRVDRLRLRAVWDADRDIGWTAGSGLDKPKVSTSGGRTEVLLDMKDVESISFPRGAPRRFFPTRDLTFSEFKTWADVAALIEPHFAKASRLEPDSPLRAEVERIRNTSADPKVRASLALQLVEDQIRYLAVTLQNGGYVPAAADDTWRRRFGDCKAKTVLLIALLRELGIEAEAALVNSRGDEVLADRLPGVRAFDHVIVRAVIGDRVYWLDGTRSGDRNIEFLRVPRLSHALPLRPKGSTLVALVQPPLQRPDAGLSVSIDASKGLDAPAPVRAEIVLGGDMGHYMKLFSSSIPVVEREKALKQAFGGLPELEHTRIDLIIDPTTGEAKIVLDGTAKLEWWPKSGGARWLLVSTGALGGGVAFKREPGPGAEAPWAVHGHPSWVSSTFQITLPGTGEGFRVEGEDVERTLAGRAYVRRSKVEKGVATIETSVRTVAAEFPNSEAAGAAEALTEMAKVRVAVRAPSHYRPTPDDITAWAAETPRAAEEYIGRGIRYASVGQHEKAIADFDEAISKAPKAAYAWSNRGISFYWSSKYDLAAADYAKAIELDPRNYVAIQGQAMLAMQDGRFADAAAAYARAADLRPSNTFALMEQARALWLLGDTDKALTVLGQAQEAEPGDLRPRFLRYSILEARNQRERALEEIDALLEERTEASELHLYRAGLLVGMSRRAEADAAFDRAIALRPTAEAYLTRLRYRRPTDIGGRLEDLELAEQVSSRAFVQRRAEILADARRYGEALAVLDKALKLEPHDNKLAEERAEVLLRAGRPKEAGRAIQRLRFQAAGHADRLNALCWIGGTRNYALEDALADCDAALKLEPRSGPILDSRGLVLLRLNRLEEALAAYDMALRFLPDNPESLYGRGLVRLRLGRQAGAEADFAAARAASPFIDEIFDGWGLTEAQILEKIPPSTAGRPPSPDGRQWGLTLPEDGLDVG